MSQITKEQKEALIKSFAINEKDTGSEPVQVAILTQQITLLTNHMKIHKKDLHSRRGLLRMVSRRKKLLTYIKNNDFAKYSELLEKLQLRGVK
jgi:small subunit ribosomal protein S15